MEKKIYYLIRSNGDLSLTVADLLTCNTCINGEMEDAKQEDGIQFTVTPVLMTEEEFENLPEGE